MSVPLRRAGLLLALPLLLMASAALAADVSRFDDLLRLVRSEPDPTVVLEKCGATVFTLNADQRAQLTEAGAPATLIDALQKKRMSLEDVQNFALVLDCSGSMKEKLPDGRTKMDAAKAVLSELVQKIPDGLNVSLTLYGQDVAAECQAVEVKRSLSPINSAEREALKKIVAGLEPVGHTPIAAALRAAGGTLEGAKGLSQVVLVTDGMETCHEDPAAVAEAVTLKYQLRGVPVVGLGIKEEEKRAVMQIARQARAKFYDTQTAEQLAPALKKVVRVTLEAESEKPEPADLPPRVKLLLKALDNQDVWTRVNAATNLAKLGAKARGAVPALARRLADDKLWLREYSGDCPDKSAALAALKKLAPERAPRLIEEALTKLAEAKNVNPSLKQWALDRLTELDQQEEKP
jgi:Mg-chelatase subunit ChlD